MTPEIILRVPEQFNECDQSPPWVWAMDDEPFKEDFRRDFLELMGLDLLEEQEDEGAKPMGMCVWVTQVHDHRSEEMVLPYKYQKGYRNGHCGERSI